MPLVQKEIKKVYLGSTQVRPGFIKVAWVYHNPTLWLISISKDGMNRITIADKNLGATTVYNSGDTLSEANAWKFYQRGNNYWFPFTWATSTSSSQVNARNYWPANYYLGSSFIKKNNWDSSNNKDLRWGVTWTNEAMKWPCDTWFHVPTNDELRNLFYMGSTSISGSLGIWSDSNPSGYKTYLKMPSAWQLAYSSGSQSNVGSRWYYWSSTYYSSNWYAYQLQAYASGYWQNGYQTGIWCSIRPFKNDAVQPDNTRTVLYQ